MITFTVTRVLLQQFKDHLLHQLGISPVSVDPWPLNVAPRTLSILAQVLLLRLQPTSGASNANASGIPTTSHSTPLPVGSVVAGSLLDPMSAAESINAGSSVGSTSTSNVVSASTGLKSSAGMQT